MATSAFSAQPYYLMVRLDLPPKGGVRPRVSGRQTYMPKSYTDWTAAATTSFRAASRRRAWEGPIGLRIKAFHKWPKSGPSVNSRWHTGTPDVDNLAKPVMDALQKAEVIPDDKFVVDLQVEALRTRLAPCVWVQVWEIVDDGEIVDEYFEGGI